MFHVEQFWQIRWHSTPNNPLDGAPGFHSLEPFQTVRHSPVIARYNPLIAMNGAQLLKSQGYFGVDERATCRSAIYTVGCLDRPLQNRSSESPWFAGLLSNLATLVEDSRMTGCIHHQVS